MHIKVKKLTNNAVLPEYKTIHSAGADIYADAENDIIIEPGEINLVPTGLSMEIPVGYEVQIRPRSGLALKGITVANSPGTIDSDYRGEVKIILANISKERFVIKNHDRIAQMVASKVDRASFEVVNELSDTERGEGGFGSTGIGRK